MDQVDLLQIYQCIIRSLFNSIYQNSICEHQGIVLTN